MAQIDHTVLSPHGIFVIMDTKNYEGWIFGMNMLSTGRRSLRHQEQVLQPGAPELWPRSGGEEVLGRSGDFPYYSVVVFDDGCTLKKVSTTHPVIYQKQLMELILDQKREVVLTGKEIDRLYATLLAAHCQGNKVRKQHTAGIQAKKARTVSNA